MSRGKQFKKDVKAVSLANAKTSVYWCNLPNDESHLIKELDKDAIEILGSMSIEKKRIYS